MTYRIARDGELYGPYSLREAERYLASGHILATDLAQPVGADEWLPITALFPTAPGHAPRTLPGGLPRLFPDPPDLRWWALVLLSLFTLNIFSALWDIWESLWMRRVERSSVAIYLYVGAAVLFFLKLPSTWQTVLYNVGASDVTPPASTWPLVIITAIFWLASRFVFRSELLRHFNGPEPIGLRLNAFLTLLFGGLYFQYHFNRINQLKRTLRISVPEA